MRRYITGMIIAAAAMFLTQGAWAVESGEGAHAEAAPAASVPAPAPAGPSKAAVQANAQNNAQIEPNLRTQQQNPAFGTLPPSLYYLNGPYLVTQGYYNPAYGYNNGYGYNGYNNSNTATTSGLLPCVAPDPPYPCYPPQSQSKAPTQQTTP